MKTPQRASTECDVITETTKHPRTKDGAEPCVKGLVVGSLLVVGSYISLAS
jgi:hypothetical protein